MLFQAPAIRCSLHIAFAFLRLAYLCRSHAFPFLSCHAIPTPMGSIRFRHSAKPGLSTPLRMRSLRIHAAAASCVVLGSDSRSKHISADYANAGPVIWLRFIAAAYPIVSRARHANAEPDVSLPCLCRACRVTLRLCLSLVRIAAYSVSGPLFACLSHSLSSRITSMPSLRLRAT